MRVLVMSDCHGMTRGAEKALEDQPGAKTVFYLGDGADEFGEISRFYPGRDYHIVAGNCDFSSDYPLKSTAVVGNVKILYTHGHMYSVKYGLGRLYDEAQKSGASVVLYGHTHVAKTEYIDGIYFVNPGAMCQSLEGSESYAVIDITDSGIMPIIIKI